MISILVDTVAISLSGVLAPGPITAATLALGSRHRHAGAMVSLGHGAVELPLMLLIIAGPGRLLESDAARIGIGLAGGLVLVLMGALLLWGARRAPQAEAPAPSRSARSPFWTGVFLTAGNPYFLLWWATVGLGLASRAVQWGALAFILFAVIHWLCDLVWLEILSAASFQGAQILGPRAQRWMLVICALMLVGFGGKFLVHAAILWWQTAAA
ncbi:MAG: LysE family transporter [Planctomycetes bacterium]|nr:LysE family transporter [Planctomycetota bacterium]